MKMKFRRILSALLVLAMVVSFLPTFELAIKASAETTSAASAAEFVYVSDISKYRKNTEAHDANNNDRYDITAVYNDYPQKDGGIFAGWYYDVNGEKPLDKSVTSGGAYAKFVPEKLMKAVAQVSTNTTYETESSSLRFVAAVESLDYVQIGFLLNKEGSSKTYTHGATTVYSSLSAALEGAGSLKPGYFDATATHMFALTLTGIKDQSANYKATPFWVTYDGTKVDHIPTANKAVIMGVNANMNAGLTPKPVVPGPNEENTLWYDASKTEYVLNTLGEFKGFVTLAQTNDFAGKTIKLGTDITWTGTWTPIPVFKGTLDGQEHTLSGISYKNTAGNATAGMFKEVEKATFKNLTIANTRMDSTAGSGDIGLLAGLAKGITVENVKIANDSYVTGSTNAGLVGNTSGANAVTFKKVWMDGNVSNAMWTGRIGGLLGNAANTSGLVVTVENCLFTGTVAYTHASSTASNYVGGFVGGMGADTKVYVRNSLSAGTMTNANTKTTTYAGSLVGIGSWRGAAYTFFENAYAAADTYAVATYRAASTYTGTPVLAERDTLLGATAATTLAGLDFAGVWTTREGEVPMIGAVDTSWYDANKTEFVISTVAQLYGFSVLQETYNFAGKTVKLGADIVLNEGDAKTWATTAPANVWNPIGKGDASKSFEGTFDGQGHTISGLYYDSASYGGGLFTFTGTAAVVKNLKLTNSYIRSTHGAEWSATGSIAAFVNGTEFYNVYSDAIIDTNSGYTGGIGGRVQGNAIIADNCEFAGTVTATGSVANYIGGIFGGFNGNTAGASVIRNSKVTGVVSGANIYVGGIIGVSAGASGASLTIENCAVSGAVTGTVGISGGYIGRINAMNTTIKGSAFTGTLNGGTKLGGFVGQTNTAGYTTTIQNSTFDGTITATNTSESTVAGFVAHVNNGNVTILDSVTEGTLVAPGPYCAGAIAYIHSTATGTINLDGIISTADVQCASSNAGGLIGRLMKAGTFTISVTNNLSKATFTTNSWATAQIIANADSHAVTAYNNYFVATTNSHTNGVESGGANLTKGPKNISEALWNYLRGLYEVGIKPDYNGFNDSGYVIMDVNDLYGFNVYNELNDMSGKTVKLGADITINTGDASDWAFAAPKYNWKPVGALTAAGAFKGNFDGQGYTISGLYCAHPNGNSLGLFREVTGTITNFKLVNSYLANTVDINHGYNGTIVAYLNGGTISKVYTDAIIYTMDSYGGGIVGFTAGTKATVSECQFDGMLLARCTLNCVCGMTGGQSRGHANYIGGMVGAATATNTDVSNCYFGGTIYNECTSAHRTAGIIGGLPTAGKVATVTGCISVGKMGTIRGNNSYHFSMIMDGRAAGGATANSATLFDVNYVLNTPAYALDGVTTINAGSAISGEQGGKQSTVRYTIPQMIADIETRMANGTSKLDFTVWNYNPGALPTLKWMDKNSINLDFHYITTEDGGKLMSVTMPGKTLDQYVDMHIEETETGKTYTTDINGETVTLPYYYLEQVNAAPVDFQDIFYGADTYITKYTGTTLAEVQSLVGNMKAYGFVEYTTNNLNTDVYYTALLFGGKAYTVTFFATTGETYISASNEQVFSPFMQSEYFKTAMNTAGGEPSSTHSDVTITSVPLDGGGDCFIIRLKNGHYIIIDGGTNRQSDRDRVAAALGASAEAYTNGDKNNPQIVVDAWFFTHAHADHVGIFRGGIYGALQVDVYIKGFYYNFTEKWHIDDQQIQVGGTAEKPVYATGYLNAAYDYEDQDDDGKNYYRKTTGDTSEFWLEYTADHKTAANVNTPSWGSKGIPVYRVQAGQKFYFDGMTVEVPYTQEQVQPSEMHLDLNGTCSWFLLTDDYGHTFLDAGDTERWNAEAVVELYSKNYKLFGADVGKTFHHGLNPLVKHTGTFGEEPGKSTAGNYDYTLVDQIYGIGSEYGDGQQTKFVFITKGASSWLAITGYNDKGGSQRDLSIHEMYYLFGYILTSKYGTKIRDFVSWGYDTVDTKIPFAAYGGDFVNGNYKDTFEGQTTVTMNASGITWDKHHTHAIYD